MPKERIHRFEYGGRRFAIDPETCFCFECDDVSWDVLEYYPAESVTRILHELKEKHNPREIKEVISELEWLRATKSILPHQPPDKFIRQFELEKGVRHLTVRLPKTSTAETVATRKWFGKTRTLESGSSVQDFGLSALEMLIGRSLDQKELSLIFLETGSIQNTGSIAGLANRAFRLATLSGKTIRVGVELEEPSLSGLSRPISSHRLRLTLHFTSKADIADALRSLEQPFSLDHVLRLFKREGIEGKVILQPESPDFQDTVPELVNMGFDHIEVDLDGTFVKNPTLQPAAMMPALESIGRFYAERLQAGKYFRLEPVAGLFYRIYEGKPESRTDPAGLHELAIDDAGTLYPGKRFMGNTPYAIGLLEEGIIDENKLAPFNNVGALTTGVCRRCWARNLCGGGNAAVHAALTGSIRTPQESWCEMQRNWMASTIAAFNLLSSTGVNFSRIYTPVATPNRKPLSLFTMLRAAMQLTVTMRPIEEADASLLAKWENWNDASYFVCHPGGLLLATVYEREMDALHPQTLEQEMVISRRNGQSIGLFRIAPDKVSGVAHAAVFLRDASDYMSPEIQKGCRLLLEEAGKQQTLRRVLTQAGEHEPPLHEFLRSLGFERVGTQREALYLHGRYHDVGVYALTIT